MDDPKVGQEFLYWYFAHHFGFTPNQVDELPFDRMVYLFELEQEYKKLEKDSIK